MTRTLGWLVAACLLAAYLLKPSPDDLIDQREKEVIRAADSLHLDLKLRLGSVRLATDTALATVTVVDVDTVKAIVQREREACDAVALACEARVAARDTRIATLERRNSAWLVLYGDMGVSAPVPTFRGLTVDGEAGVALRLDRQTQIQAGVTTRGDVRLSVRRSVTLF
jgi:hypothetical protein